MPGDFGLALPAQDRAARELGPVVADDRLGLAVKPDHGIELAADPLARDRRVGHERQALTGVVVDHRERAEPSPRAEDVREEVQAPPLGPGTAGMGIGSRVPVARLRPRRRLTARPSSRSRRRSFLRFILIPSRLSIRPIRREPKRRRSAAISRIRVRISGRSGARARLTVFGSRPVRRQARREPRARAPASPVAGRRPPC